MTTRKVPVPLVTVPQAPLLAASDDPTASLVLEAVSKLDLLSFFGGILSNNNGRTKSSVDSAVSWKPPEVQIKPQTQTNMDSCDGKPKWLRNERHLTSWKGALSCLDNCSCVFCCGVKWPSRETLLVLKPQANLLFVVAKTTSDNSSCTYKRSNKSHSEIEITDMVFSNRKPISYHTAIIQSFNSPTDRSPNDSWNICRDLQPIWQNTRINPISS